MAILAFLKLIRVHILLLVLAFQYAIRHLILEPMLQINGFELLVSNLNFGLIASATFLIGAGGFAINDYFDLKIDRINRPKNIIVGRLVKRRVAMASHIVLTSAGLMVATYAFWKIGLWQLISLYLLAGIILWFYSTNFKNRFLLGNLLMAVLAASTVMVVGLIEIPLQNKVHADVIAEVGFPVFNALAFWVIGYSVAIFSLTLAREITKDIVDMKGDKAYDCRTIAIALGVKKTKMIVMAIYLSMMLAFYWAYDAVLNFHSGFNALSAVFVLAIFLQVGLLYRARVRKQFKQSIELNNAMTILVLLSTYLIFRSIQIQFMI